MSILQRWQNGSVALIAAGLMAACGGGGGGSDISNVSVTPTPAPSSQTSPITPVEPGMPQATDNVAVDGLNWLNFRRSQAGLAVLTRSAQIDSAAQNHSVYQRLNNKVTHDEEEGKAGFTGRTPLQRLNFVGYQFSGSYAFGEVISAASSNSGVYLAEELITAIYHRFVVFEPKFKEIGSGDTATAGGYHYFTTNLTANNGFGVGLGPAVLATWPAQGQTGVTRNFLSDSEVPDPVEGQNEVGYPVSVHADIDVNLTVTTFTMRPRGGDNINVKLLAKSSGDIHAPDSAASIVPLAVLAPNTTYDVNFVGASNGRPITKTWSFTTKP